MKGRNNVEHKPIFTLVEEIQLARNSRQSKKKYPLLHIIYLPTHTRNNNIFTLERTFKRFLMENKLWTNYNIEYSNAKEDTGDIKEIYNEKIKTFMEKTRKNNMKGCILLLGNQGSVGITYKDCDLTLSLDDGHNLDNQKTKICKSIN